MKQLRIRLSQFIGLSYLLRSSERSSKLFNLEMNFRLRGITKVKDSSWRKLIRNFLQFSNNSLRFSMIFMFSGVSDCLLDKLDNLNIGDCFEWSKAGEKSLMSLDRLKLLYIFKGDSVNLMSFSIFTYIYHIF